VHGEPVAGSVFLADVVVRHQWRKPGQASGAGTHDSVNERPHLRVRRIQALVGSDVAQGEQRVGALEFREPIIAPFGRGLELGEHLVRAVVHEVEQVLG